MKLTCCVISDPGCAVAAGAVESIARSCSPRVEPHGDTAVLFDASGLLRAMGPPATIAAEVARLAQAQGMSVRVAIAEMPATAWLLAHARPGVTVVAPEAKGGRAAAALAPIPLGWLATLPASPVDHHQSAAAQPAPLRRRGSSSRHYRMAPGPVGTTASASRTASARGREDQQTAAEHLAILARWGLRTVGDLAALPRSDVRARLGPLAVRWHQAACGEDVLRLVPAGEPIRFRERLELEWPIEGLEPLAFVLGRLCDQLETTLERADRGAVEVTTRLTLVTRAVHERVLHLPAAMRESRVLRTLILLDIESHQPAAAMDVVEIELAVVPGRIVQGSLLTRSLPSPEDLATLVARLGALVGESRVGAPVVVDSYDERTVSQRNFQLPTHNSQLSAVSSELSVASCELSVVSCELKSVLRRYRLPIPARVTLDHGMPVRVEPSARGVSGGRVQACAGPWRSSGRWWAGDRTTWDRDAWDVELADGVYRLSRDRQTGEWALEGAFD